MTIDISKALQEAETTDVKYRWAQASTIHDWLQVVLPREEFMDVASVPVEILESLYGDVAKFGPNHANANNFIADFKKFMSGYDVERDGIIYPVDYVTEPLPIPVHMEVQVDHLLGNLRIIDYQVFSKAGDVILSCIIMDGILDGYEPIWSGHAAEKATLWANMVGLDITEYRWRGSV